VEQHQSIHNKNSIFKPLAAAFIFLAKISNNLRDLTHSEYYNYLIEILTGGLKKIKLFRFMFQIETVKYFNVCELSLLRL